MRAWKEVIITNISFLVEDPWYFMRGIEWEEYSTPNRAPERGIEKALVSLIEINQESTRKSIWEITTVSSSESTSERASIRESTKQVEHTH